jgi:hypothetical protein
MENKLKYPRTKHFDFSPGVSNDDKILHDLSNFIGKEIVILEKRDGENCLDGETMITTENGVEKIKDICESKSKCNVLSYKLETNSLEYKQILNHKICEPDIDDIWFELELENGSTIRLTSEHYVFLPELNIYRKVSDLSINDDVIFLP